MERFIRGYHVGKIILDEPFLFRILVVLHLDFVNAIHERFGIGNYLTVWIIVLLGHVYVLRFRRLRCLLDGPHFHRNVVPFRNRSKLGLVTRVASSFAPKHCHSLEYRLIIAFREHGFKFKELLIRKR